LAAKYLSYSPTLAQRSEVSYTFKYILKVLYGENMKILAISGSNKTYKPSLNNALIDYTLTLGTDDLEIKKLDIVNLPVYSEDYDSNFPEEAKNLKSQIAEADAIIIATPEYNRSVPPVLANAISWSSRPYPDNAWKNKPVGIMGATGGAIATYGAQDHLRAMLAHLAAHIVTSPGVYVAGAGEKIVEGKLIDQETQERVKLLVETTVNLAKQLQK
jgi:chromate reductase